MILMATRLGIIACRYLVKGFYENRYISAPEIAQHYGMNVRALMPALRQLGRAGILRSRVGGKSPGFIFSKDPAEVSLYHIFAALEGDKPFSCCKEVMPDLRCDCADRKKCGVFSLFESVIDSTMMRLSSISIADHALL